MKPSITKITLNIGGIEVVVTPEEFLELRAVVNGAPVQRPAGSLQGGPIERIHGQQGTLQGAWPQSPYSGICGPTCSAPNGRGPVFVGGSQHPAAIPTVNIPN